MKVLFTHSYFLHFDPKQLRAATPYPPLGTLYAMAYLRQHGFDVKLFDTQFSKSADEIKPVLKSYQPDILVIYDDGFNYLTKMCLTNMREAAFTMQAYGKEAGCRVIVSSSDSTDHLKEYLHHKADSVIIGEAEHCLLEIVSAMKENKPISEIKGLAYQNEHGEVIKTDKRQVMKDLDALPPPAWDLLDITPYREIWLKHHGYFAINFVTTRGCPYKCNWCAKPIYGNRYNSHSAAGIARQIKELQEKFRFTHVWFADDIFGLKPNWLKEFSEAVRKENLVIRYKIQSRADLLVEPDTVKYLAESGCETVWMGAESGSQKILDAMDKGISVPQIHESAALLKARGINVCLFLQFGYPGETIDDISKTLQMVNQVMPAEIGVSVSYPLPGTKFYDKVKEELLAKANWTDSDDLDLMFKNTYSSAFYKTLHRYIHKRYRAALGRQALKELLSGLISARGVYRVGSLAYYYPLAALIRKRLRNIEAAAVSLE